MAKAKSKTTAKKPTSRSRTSKKGRRSSRRARVVTWQEKFIATLRHSLNVTYAARVAGVARRTVYDARDTDLAFAQAWDEALDEAVESAEGELYRRAVRGNLKPVFQGGKLVGKVREWSDTLLIFLLKAHKPEVYRETIKHETWEDDVLRVLPGLTPEQQARVYAELVERGFADRAQALFAKVGLPVQVGASAPGGTDHAG